MTTDVLIGQAYFLRFDPTLWEAARPYAPLGALYAAAWARSGGYRVALFDAMLAESVEEWTAALEHRQPSVAVIYEDSFNYLSKMCLSRMRDAALEMIATACQRGVAVIVAGSDATDHPAIYLEQGATAVIVGEGEVTLVHLLDALRRGSTDLSEVDGIVFHKGRSLVRTQPRALSLDLAASARLFFDEHLDHARLPVPLQLVREADLRAAVHSAFARGRRGRNCVAEIGLSTRSPVDHGRHLRLEARLGCGLCPRAGRT